MKPVKATFTIISMFFAVLLTYGQTRARFCRTEIFASPLEIANRTGLHLDHGYYDYQKGSFITDLGTEQVAKLNAASLRYTILVQDVTADFLQRNKTSGFYDNTNDPVRNSSNPGLFNRQNFESPCAAEYTSLTTPTLFTSGSMGGYYTYAEIITKIDELVSTYPGFVQKINLGLSQSGTKTIWGVKISDNVATDEAEPEILYTGLIHAREPMGMMNMFFFMQYLLQNYNTDTRMKEVVDNRELFFIPCANPDGYEYNHTTDPSGGGMQRKNRRNVGTDNPGSGQYKGVDINRNFSVDFGYDDIGSSSVASDDDYRGGPLAGSGGVPFTEPEAVAIRNFCTSHHISIEIDNHCYGNYLSLPYGIAANHPLTTDEINVYSYAPAQMMKYNCFKSGTSIQTVGYNTNGTAKDWYVAGDIGTGTKGKIYSFTSEAGDAADGFWPVQARIIPIAKEMFFQNLQLAYLGGSFADIEDATDIALASNTGNLSFNVKRVGLQNSDVTVTVIPLENIVSVGSPVVINAASSLPNYFDSYSGNISYTLPAAITGGQRIRFIWKVQTGGITTAIDTIVKFYNPLTVFADDMEGTFTTNWTSSTAGTWNYAADQKVSGTKGLTESPGVRYAANRNTNATVKTVFDLSDATAAYLTFWVRHEAHNCYDNMQIQIANNWNGTTGTFNPVCGKTTVAENDGALASKPAITGRREFWTRELVPLTSFMGFASVGLRFNFTSNSDTVKGDGYFIDDVKLIKSTSGLVTLPVKFINITGKLTAEKAIQIQWQAETDQKHKYFEVEKSADRQQFTSLQRIDGFTYETLDRNPSFGNNYYRIKDVDMDGNITYSKIINIVYNPSMLALMLYPNPAKDNLNLRINTLKPETLKVLVTDLTGKTVYNKQFNVDNGGEELKIDVKSWSSQVYIVKVLDSNNETLTVQKFIKQ